MKILLQCDVKGWAIDNLAQSIIKYNPHYQFKLVYCGPRDAAQKQHQDSFEKDVKAFSPDIIHFLYYRTGTQLIEALPFLKTYKIIIGHQNQRTKALRFCDWKSIGIDHLTTCTQKCKEYLVKDCGQPKDFVTSIKYGINFDEFIYDDKEPETPAIGYAGRIVPWKGLKEVAEVGKELNYPVMFMGRQDKIDYWNTISEEVQKSINFSFMDCKDDERLDYYRSLTCYINFSKDWFEEGTLEYLEAMACGVPVITSSNGLAGELAIDGKNALIVPFEDKEALKKAVDRLMKDKELRQTLRKNAWETVKNLTDKKMAYEYSILYNKVKEPSYNLVSVILPTYERAEQIGKILKTLNNQTYPHFEVIVCDDNTKTKVEDGRTIIQAICDDMRKEVNYTIKYIKTDNNGYGLAQARNMGVIEAEGDTLVFLDSRLMPDENAIMFFNEYVKKARDIRILDSNNDINNKKIWFFGDKGAQKPNFVENFSAVSREHFIKFGMMSERITSYGGMSQEIRTRWISQGGEFKYIGQAQATQLIKSGKNTQRRKDIISMKFLLYRLYRGDNY